MKYITQTVLVVIAFFSLVANVAGQTGSPSATLTVEPSVTATPAGETKLDKDIQNLKNKLVDKVAEIQGKEQKAIAGTINKVSSGNLSIKTSDDEGYDVKIDSDLTKIYKIAGMTTKELKSEDLIKDSFVIVTGPLIDKTVNANNIYLDEQYFVKSGKVTEINRNDYYLKVTTTDKDNLTLDIETFTKMQLVNIKTLEMEKSGFSKLKEGDTIQFVYKKTGDEKEVNRYAAQKFLIIPQEYFMK